MISQRKKRPIQLSGTQKSIWHKDFILSYSLCGPPAKYLDSARSSSTCLRAAFSIWQNIKKPHIFSSVSWLQKPWRGMGFSCFLRWLSLLIFFYFQLTQRVSSHIVLDDKLTCSQGHIRRRKKFKLKKKKKDKKKKTTIKYKKKKKVV